MRKILEQFFQLRINILIIFFFKNHRNLKNLSATINNVTFRLIVVTIRKKKEATVEVGLHKKIVEVGMNLVGKSYTCYDQNDNINFES
jgi:hypothetical protein